MVTFYQFVQPALKALSGADYKAPPVFNVECTEPIKKVTGRTEFQRGILFEENGTWKVKPLPNQGSAMLSSMSVANCFIVLNESSGNRETGELVHVQLLEGII
jgi:molybdopterin molybdotransferase